MELLYHPISMEHDTGMHPENPKRLEVFAKLPQTEFINGEEFLPLVHSREYIEKVRHASNVGAHLDQETMA